MSELVITRVRDAAARLHLANLTENLEALVARAEGATMGYLEFLDLVLEEETGVREGRRFRNALKLSGLPHHKDPGRLRLRLPARPRRPARSRTWPRSASSRPGPTWPSWARPGWARRCWRWGWHRRLPGRVLHLLHRTTLAGRGPSEHPGSGRRPLEVRLTGRLMVWAISASTARSER